MTISTNAGSKRMPTAADFGRPPVPHQRKPALVFQPHTYQALCAGVDLLTAAVRPTLGPLPRVVAVGRVMRSDAPEILDDGATIARRMIGLSDRSQDVGAMVLRNGMWKMHQEVGDGATTMAVLFQSILRLSIQAVLAGECNAMELKRALEEETRTHLSALQQQARLLDRRQIAQAAETVCPDPALAKLLAEVFDIVGAEGIVNVEADPRPRLEREYIEGTYWSNSGLASPLLETDTALHRAVLEDAHVLVSDIAVQDATQLIPLLDQVIRAKIPNLALVALNFSGAALGLLLHNKQGGALNLFAARAPFSDPLEQSAALQDLALMTGARYVNRAAGDTLERMQLGDLGRVRRAWASEDYFGIVGGKGDPRAVRKQIADLRTMLAAAHGEQHERLQKRLGHLMGGVALVRVGAATMAESKARTALAERAVRTLRNIVSGGVVPGGGAALLKCSAALLPAYGTTGAHVAARRILKRSLEEPLRVIAQNAGFSPDAVVQQVYATAEGYGFDVRRGEIADMYARGIVDPLGVVEKALCIAISGVGMALTTDVIVHRKKPPESTDP